VNTLGIYISARGAKEDNTMIEITGQDFDNEVLKSEVPVFVCFTAPPCGSCFALCLVTDDLAEEYEGKIKFIKIDVTAEPELAAKYHILPLPAVILFKQGSLMKKLGGFQSKAFLRNSLNELIA
jgi:thioredoxin-like negative regulator of GroEL